MKITLCEISKSAGDQKIKKNETTTGNKFDQILHQTINKSSSSEDHKMTLPPLQNIASTRFDLISNMDKAQNIKRVEKFLDVLENYQNKLEDSAVTLKDMSHLVTHMKSEIENMLPFLNSLPDEDGMKDILNTALVTSTVEVMKFNRGDYL